MMLGRQYAAYLATLFLLGTVSPARPYALPLTGCAFLWLLAVAALVAVAHTTRHRRPVPWRKLIRAQHRAERRRRRALHRARRTLRWLDVLASVPRIDAPMRRHPPRRRHRIVEHHAAQRSMRKQQHNRITFQLEHNVIEPSASERREQLTTLVEQASQTAQPAPILTAVHERGCDFEYQFAMTPALTFRQQHDITNMLRKDGVRGRWRDDTTLSVSCRHERRLNRTDGCDEALWFPVLRVRQGRLWWRLPRHQHVLLAGAAGRLLPALLHAIRRKDHESYVPIWSYDPEGRLDEWFDGEVLRPQDNALALARNYQLREHYSAQRQLVREPQIKPLLIVASPDAGCWPDLRPLLAGNAVQAVIVTGNRPLLPALRLFCQNAWGIETIDNRTEGLPDACRPHGVPVPGLGETVAWTPGGTTFWRGTPLRAGERQ